jgi:hypothetical protein
MFEYLCNVSDALRIARPEQIQDLANSLSATQYRSKKWLIEQLKQTPLPPNPSVLILGGWYGSFLVPMLKQEFSPSKIYLTDCDSETLSFAEVLHNARFMEEEVVKMGIVDVEKNIDRIQTLNIDIVINTSCEHMSGIDKIKVKNKNALYAFQSCDEKNDPGHKNAVETTDQFVDQCQFTTVLMRGRLNLGHKNRFMVIGLKQ